MKISTSILFILLFFQIARSQTYYDIAETISDWENERVENARNGITETVQMPLAFRCYGWGCDCPMYYIGVSPCMQEGPFIDPKIIDGMPTESNSMGYSYIVTGYFTGEITQYEFAPEESYSQSVFIIQSFKINEEGENTLAPKILDTTAVFSWEKLLIGKWKTVSKNDEKPSICNQIIFKKNGKFMQKGSEKLKGTWQVKAKQIMINTSSQNLVIWEILSLDDNKLLINDDGTKILYQNE